MRSLEKGVECRRKGLMLGVSGGDSALVPGDCRAVYAVGACRPPQARGRDDLFKRRDIRPPVPSGPAPGSFCSRVAVVALHRSEAEAEAFACPLEQVEPGWFALTAPASPACRMSW